MLRDYQQEAVDTLSEWWKKTKRPAMLQLATGAGKSHIIAAIANMCHNKNVLILQPSKEILEQNLEKIVQAGVPREWVAVCSASAGDWKIGTGITLATIGTIAKYAIDYCQHIETIIVDEADVVPNDQLKSQYMQFFNNIPRAKVVGLTACVDGDTEVLTPTGWVKFKDLEGEEGVFAQWEHTKGEEGKIVFERASIYRGWSDTINKTGWQKEGTELYFTNGHTFPTLVDWHRFVDRKSGTANFTDRERWFVSGKGAGGETILTPYERLCIALQADGHYDRRYGEVVAKGENKGKRRFNIEVVKPRKQERLKRLLEESGVSNTVAMSNRWYNGSQVYSLEGRVYIDHNAKDLWEVFDITRLSYEKAREIIDEMCYWDGIKSRENGTRVFSTTDLRQAEFYQSVGVLGGYMTRISSYTPKKKNHSVSYRVWLIDRFTRATAALSAEENISWNKPVYCLHTKTGYFVARRDNRVFITGNTPWRNKVYSQQFCDPKVYCRPVTRIPTMGDKEHPIKEANYGTWFWGGIIYKCPISRLQKLGFLSPTKYYIAETNWDFIDDVPGRVDYEMGQMSKWADIDENTAMFTRAVKWCMENNLKTIMFSPNIDMNFRLVNVIRALGGTAECMDSEHDNRKSRSEKMARFRNGDFQFLVNVGMVGRGVDVPSVDCVFECRPTKSLSFYMQMIGRCLRIDPDNPDKIAYIVDLTENFARFGRVEDVRLEKQTKEDRAGNMRQTDAIVLSKGGKSVIWDRVS